MPNLVNWISRIFTLLTAFLNVSNPFEFVVPPNAVVDPPLVEPPAFIFRRGAGAGAAGAGAGGAPASSSDVREPPLELTLLERGIHSLIEWMWSG